MKYAQIISPILRLQDLFGLFSNERKEDGGEKKTDNKRDLRANGRRNSL